MHGGRFPGPNDGFLQRLNAETINQGGQYYTSCIWYDDDIDDDFDGAEIYNEDLMINAWMVI